LAFHLCGDTTLRDSTNGFAGIGVCAAVPSKVAGRAKVEMATKTANKKRKSSLSAAGQITASEEGDLRAEKMQATIPHLSNKDAKKIKADNSVSDMFDGHGWAHHVVDGHLLRAAFKDVAAAGPDYKLPCRSTDTTHRHTTMNHMPDSHIAPYKPYFYRACSARESRANTRKSRVK